MIDQSTVVHDISGIYILAISPPPNFVPIWETGKNLEEDLKKGREKGGKEEKKGKEWYNTC